jgi:hypothetical protein
MLDADAFHGRGGGSGWRRGFNLSSADETRRGKATPRNQPNEEESGLDKLCQSGKRRRPRSDFQRSQRGKLTISYDAHLETA